jgi:hypothetical protein
VEAKPHCFLVKYQDSKIIGKKKVQYIHNLRGMRLFLKQKKLSVRDFTAELDLAKIKILLLKVYHYEYK